MGEPSPCYSRPAVDGEQYNDLADGRSADAGGGRPFGVGTGARTDADRGGAQVTIAGRSKLRLADASKPVEPYGRLRADDGPHERERGVRAMLPPSVRSDTL